MSIMQFPAPNELLVSLKGSELFYGNKIYINISMENISTYMNLEEW